ncbi:hypothetical protein CLOLEP_00398 [[Clostridium] leptum DSM 753]|uniref:Uncharacterized protein n=1 Tax=[Clostridium] leptum DSM 753 TaxID=428125 RepID=A7VPC1_9FIRM|nr:hypothetical protein CLOLEP_00398 [[Clostridium] leptum DSM 753]
MFELFLGKSKFRKPGTPICEGRHVGSLKSRRENGREKLASLLHLSEN